MNNKIKILISVVFIALCAVAFKIKSTPPPIPTGSIATSKSHRPATEVVSLVNSASDTALEKLTFLELYFLKNAVMANSGYVFAPDRTWLKTYFAPCDKSEDDPDTCHVTPICVQGCEIFDLSQFDFPMVTGDFVFQMTPAMNSAMARIRQTQFKKLRTLPDGIQIQSKVASDFNSLPSFTEELEEFEGECNLYSFRFALGRPVPAVLSDMDCNQWEQPLFEQSLVRDLKGDLSLLGLIDQFKQDRYEFDLAELLGLC